MHFRALGFFPNEFKPRVIWTAVEASPNLFELAAALEATLEPLGFPRESRTFVPHLTLARINSTKGIENLVRAADALKSYDFGSARESEFHLFESVLKRAGARIQETRHISVCSRCQVNSAWLIPIVAYLLGSIPFGLLIVKAFGGPDIREIGSGNIGAANVTRNAGKLAGILTLALDAGKGYLAVWLASRISQAAIFAG